MNTTTTATTAVAASQIVSASLIASLMQTLIEQGLLSAGCVAEIYERALQTVENGERSCPANKATFEMAREMLQFHLQQPQA